MEPDAPLSLAGTWGIRTKLVEVERALCKFSGVCITCARNFKQLSCAVITRSVVTRLVVRRRVFVRTIILRIPMLNRGTN